MERHDLYKSVHKGLRLSLFDAMWRLERTDFSDRAAALRTAEEVRQVFSLLAEHGAHEDRVILPEIARVNPAVFSELRADHSRVDGLQHELNGLLDRLADATDAERRSFGEKIRLKFGRFLAEHMLHMEREETSGNRVLWAHHSDESLRAMHGQILGAIAPDRMMEWAAIMIPALDPRESEALLTALEAKMPPAMAGRLGEFRLQAGSGTASVVEVLHGRA
mgnify:CR=1 FL=1